MSRLALTVMVECTAAFLDINHSLQWFLKRPLKDNILQPKASGFLQFTLLYNLEFQSWANLHELGSLLQCVSHLPVFIYSHACAEMDVQRGRIREHEARKPVVLMFSPWSFDLASRQLSLISVFVDDYWGKWVVRHRSYLFFSLIHVSASTHPRNLLAVRMQTNTTQLFSYFFAIRECCSSTVQ